MIISYNRNRKHEESEASQKIATKLGVKTIVGIDGSLVSLWDGLKDHFKGTFTTASVKLHFATNLVTGALSWFDLTSGATHDSQRFPRIAKGVLYIFDLGYWSLSLFSDIQNQGGYFLSRVKSNAKLKVSKVVSGCFGKSIIGADLLSFSIYEKKGNCIEFIATLSNSSTNMEVRVLGFWNKHQKKYHWYVTNLEAPKNLIRDLYRLRWQIELSFKSMKSTLNFDQIPTLSPNAVLSLCLIALCNYVMATLVRAEADKQQKKSHQKRVIPSIQRAAFVFRECADDLFSLIRIGSRITNLKIDRIMNAILPLLRSTFDPNFKQRQNTYFYMLIVYTN